MCLSLLCMSNWRAADWAPAPLTQPRRAPVFVRLVARTAGFSDPTRRLLPRRRMSSARPASAQQTRCSDHPRVGEHPGLSPVLDGSSCRAASRFKPETLRGEITLLPQRKVAARLTMQKAFHGHNTEPGSAARLGNFLWRGNHFFLLFWGSDADYREGLLCKSVMMLMLVMVMIQRTRGEKKGDV